MSMLDAVLDLSKWRKKRGLQQCEKVLLWRHLGACLLWSGVLLAKVQRLTQEIHGKPWLTNSRTPFGSIYVVSKVPSFPKL